MKTEFQHPSTEGGPSPAVALLARAAESAREALGAAMAGWLPPGGEGALASHSSPPLAHDVTLSDGTPLGTLYVTQPGRLWSDADRAVLRLAAETAAARHEFEREQAARRAAADELELLQSLTQALASTDDVGEALQSALEGICLLTGWCEGEAWVQDETSPHLTLAASHGDGSPEIEEFVERSRRRVFGPGDGFAGRVWQTGRTLWQAHLPGCAHYDRKAEAADAGLHSAVAVPVPGRAGPVAVFVFHQRTMEPEDERRARQLATVARQAGRLLEQRAVELRLRASEARLRDAHEAATLGYWEYDVPTGAFRLSDTLVALLGFAPGDRPGFADGLDRLHPDDAHLTRTALERLLELGESYQLDQRVLLPDGGLRHVHSRGRARRDATGRVVAIVGTCQDITARKVAEEQLARRMRELRSLLENATDVIMRYDRHFRVLFVNPAIEAISARKPAQYLGRTTAEFGTPSELVARWETALAEVFATREPRIVELSAPTPSGPRDFSSRLTPEFNERGDVETVLVVTRDVTEAKRAEDTLRRRKHEFAALATLAPVGIFRCDARGDCTYVNPHWLALTGLSAEEAAGRGWSAALHPGDRDRVLSAWSLASLTGEAFSEDYRYRRADGRVSWVTCRATPLFDERGVLTGFLGAVLDLTDRHLAEERLQRSEARFRGAFEAAACGMAIVGPDGRWLDVNASLCTMLGYTREELLARRFQDLTHPDDLASNLAQTADLFAGRRASYRMIKRYLHRDGRIVRVRLSGSVVREADGTPLHAVAQIEDITREHEARAALQQSEARLAFALEGTQDGLWDWNIVTGEMFWSEQWCRMLGFAPGEVTPHVSAREALVHPDDRPAIARALDAHLRGETPQYHVEHRMRTKSGDWRWILDRGRVVERDAAGQPLRAVGAQTDITDTRRTERERASGLAARLLMVNRTPPAHLGRVDLGEALHGATPLLRGVLSPAVALSLSVAPGLPPVRADRQQLEQALMILAVNARDAMPAGGRLEIAAALERFAAPRETRHGAVPAGAWVRLDVRDTGTGMTPEVLERLFEPFFTTKAAGLGSGLGLSTLRGIVADADGAVTAESTPGTGATFSVYWRPAAD